MRKLSLLGLSPLFLLVGCNQPQMPQDATVDPATSGIITFTLKPAIPAQDLNGQALPTPTNVRVLISNASTGFKLIKDVAVGAGTSTIEARVPAKTGYKLEAFSYLTKTESDKRILKDGFVNNINVTQNETTTVGLSLQPLNMQLSIPSEIISGEQFKITLANRPTSISGEVQVRLSMTNFTQDYNFIGSALATAFRNEITTNAPSSETAGALYIQSRAYVDGRFLQAGDIVNTFAYYTPSVDFGESPITTALNLPAGSISIGITY